MNKKGKKVVPKGGKKTSWVILVAKKVVKNPPAKTGDTGLISGPERSHMLQSN